MQTENESGSWGFAAVWGQDFQEILMGALHCSRQTVLCPALKKR